MSVRSKTRRAQRRQCKRLLAERWDGLCKILDRGGSLVVAPDVGAAFRRAGVDGAAAMGRLAGTIEFKVCPWLSSGVIAAVMPPRPFDWVSPGDWGRL